MQLITGGMGFIGTHTTRAFLDLGEPCVITRHRTSRESAFFADELGKRLFVEPLDVQDREALRQIGKRHRISGIVHLASGPAVSSADPFEDSRAAVAGLLNVLSAAQEWGAKRVCVASTIGVYGGVTEGVLKEEAFLSLSATHVIPTFKKVAELLGGYLGNRIGVEVLSVRIGAIWGPLGRPASLFFALPGMVHSAVKGPAGAAAASPRTVYAEDGSDLCYVKDCGRAIALLQLAGGLRHGVYNVGSGRPTTYGEVAAAIRGVVPEAAIELADGHDPAGPGVVPFMDITRIRADAGYQPQFDVEKGIADYVAWLRAGNER